MNRFGFATCIAAILALSAPAFAGGNAPHPTAEDADGDGAWIATMDVNGDGKKDAADINVRKIDCDDSTAAESPLNREIYGNGLNDDCNAATSDTLPLTESERARFKSTEYKGSWSDAIFAAEHAACTAATGRCKVDGKNGKFVIVDTDADSFVDIYVNGGHIYRHNGEPADGRDVVNKEQLSGWRGEKKSSSSSSGSGSGSGSGGGVSTSSARKIGKEEADKAVKTEKEERLAADVVHDQRLGAIEEGDEGRDNSINRLGDRQQSLADQIEESERVQAERDREQDRSILSAYEKAEKAERDAGNASRDAGTALSESMANAAHSPLVEGGVVGGVEMRNGLSGEHSGDPLRAPTLGLVGFGLRAGVDGDWFEVAGFGTFQLGGDGVGTGADLALLVGVEALRQIDLGGTHVGGWLGYSHVEDHANVLDSVVIDRGGLIGLVVNRDFAPGVGRATGFVRAGVGPTVQGFRGVEDGESVVPAPNVSLHGSVQIGFAFGAGARL